MADKTFGVNVSEEVQEKVQNMILGSDLTAKEWFEKAMALVEVNELKEGASEYTKDLNELEVHTTRIFDLVSNIVKRANYLKENETKGLLEKLENKDTIIAEYKEKIDSMIDLVTKYQGYAVENETLKQDYVQEKGQLQVQLNEIVDQLVQQKDEIKTYQQTIQSLKDAHSLEIERLEAKKNYELDRELLNQEKDLQQQLAALQKQHHEEVKAFYDEKNNKPRFSIFKMNWLNRKKKRNAEKKAEIADLTV